MAPHRSCGTGPRIFVASLADHNEGRLHGRWIRADQDPAGIFDEVAEMLDRSPTPGAEEWFIADAEGFGDVRVDSFEDLAVVADLARQGRLMR